MASNALSNCLHVTIDDSGKRDGDERERIADDLGEEMVLLRQRIGQGDLREGVVAGAVVGDHAAEVAVGRAGVAIPDSVAHRLHVADGVPELRLAHPDRPLLAGALLRLGQQLRRRLRRCQGVVGGHVEVHRQQRHGVRRRRVGVAVRAGDLEAECWVVGAGAQRGEAEHAGEREEVGGGGRGEGKEEEEEEELVGPHCGCGGSG